MIEYDVVDVSKRRNLKAAGYRIIRRYENNGWYVCPLILRSLVIGPVAERLRANIIWHCRFDAFFSNERRSRGANQP
jgi:hypothetical protein